MPTPASRAIAHVRQRAERAREGARAQALAILSGVGEPDGALDGLAEIARDLGRVTLNFHPDRYVGEGHTVAEGLLRDGRYLCQFATHISNGSLTAFPGGERDEWERELFGGAYHDADGCGVERPKYGALDLMAHAEGGSPRFGSCYFVLRPHMSARATFTWGDSHARPEHVGTTEVLEPILAAMLNASAAQGGALGVRGITVGELLRRIHRAHASRSRLPTEASPGRALDEYIEAHIHGPIELANDVERLVVDPSFVGTPTGDALVALCDRYAIHLGQHQGFALGPSDVPADVRGPRMVPLAHRIAGDSGVVDAATLGCAAASLHHDPGSWRSWGTYEETLQDLKQMWHVLVKAGRAR
jgi:hypothetical protein